MMVDAFYSKVRVDPVIGYIFTEVAKVNWDKHLPVMYDFWENAIFFSGAYQGNPLDIHRRLHQVVKLEPRHFERWNQLFTTTIDELFTGEHAELAKSRALNISRIMQAKIFQG